MKDPSCALSFAGPVTISPPGRNWKPGSKVKDVFNIPCDQLNWKLMIRVPTFVSLRDLKAAVKQLQEKGKIGESDKVELETIKEGETVWRRAAD